MRSPTRSPGRSLSRRRRLAKNHAYSGGAGRWVIAAAVVVSLVYPVARWMIGGGGGAAVTQPGADEVRLSFKHYQAGRYQKAIAAAKEMLASNPNSADAFLGR